MLTTIESHLVVNTVIPAIDSGEAKRIDAECFTQDDGYEDRWVVEFFALWGRVIRSCYDKRSTMTTYQFVNGESAERIMETHKALHYSI